MRNLHSVQSFSFNQSSQLIRWRCRLSILPLVLGVALGCAGRVNAQSAPTGSDAPPELLQTLTQIDAAASQGKLQEVMSFYSPGFSNSDGLTYVTLEEALKALWQRYPRLTYATQLNSWERDGNAIVAETTTTIATAPTQKAQPNALSQRSVTSANSNFTLTATVTSRQRFEDQKVVQQEILAEQSRLTVGNNPPTVTVSLPEQVRTGQTYDFDAVVTEPLGNRLLLGAVLEEPIQASGYLNAAPIELELLASGGLFKVGRAPIMPDNRWISAILIREDGITTETRRLRVVQSTNPSR